MKVEGKGEGVGRVGWGGDRQGTGKSMRTNLAFSKLPFGFSRNGATNVTKKIKSCEEGERVSEHGA